MNTELELKLEAQRKIIAALTAERDEARKAMNAILNETYESADGKCLSCAGANEIASRYLNPAAPAEQPRTAGETNKETKWVTTLNHATA